ncbi:unnamed protein product [marine sediment metagenome]|uniref:Uncharacterized protein n=1 Tax=marine sediment metagenome TaxID=412755 RepID=X0RLJ6_9ZZZZ
MKELDFSTKLKEVPVKLDGKSYTLRELGGEERDQYVDLINERITISKDGEVESISQYAGIRSKLVSDSLFDSEGANVSIETINKFPSSVLQSLFKKAQKLSAINKKNKKKAKNN